MQTAPLVHNFVTPSARQPGSSFWLQLTLFHSAQPLPCAATEEARVDAAHCSWAAASSLSAVAPLMATSVRALARAAPAVSAAPSPLAVEAAAFRVDGGADVGDADDEAVSVPEPGDKSTSDADAKTLAGHHGVAGKLKRQ